MNLVILTVPEAQWLARNVLKTKYLLEVHSKKDAQILERKTYKTLAKIAPKAQALQERLDAFGNEQYELEVMLDRKEKLEVKSMLDNTVKALEMTVLPEYARKGLLDKKADIEGKIKLLRKLGRKMK